MNPVAENLLAAAADPDASYEAAAQHVRSGRAQRNRDLVLRLVCRECRWQPMTAVELWVTQKDEPDALSRHEVSRRLPDLEKQALVRKALDRFGKLKQRMCRINRTSMCVWEPTDHGRAIAGIPAESQPGLFGGHE